MKEIVKFEYYYGNEAEQYSFFRIPKTLFTDLNFKKLSVEAKILMEFYSIEWACQLRING